MSEKPRPEPPDRWPLLLKLATDAAHAERVLLDVVEEKLALLGKVTEPPPVKATPVHSHRVVVLELDPWPVLDGEEVTTLQLRYTATPTGVVWDADLLNDTDPATEPRTVRRTGIDDEPPWWVRELAERYRDEEVR